MADPGPGDIGGFVIGVSGIGVGAPLYRPESAVLAMRRDCTVLSNRPTAKLATIRRCAVLSGEAA